jgi:transcriptional regulator with GAF, ATPase, and Fis domain
LGSSERGRGRLRRVHELSRLLSAESGLEVLLPLVVEHCRDSLEVEGGVVIMLLDPDRNELFVPYVARSASDHGEAVRSIRFPADRGIVGDALRTGRAECVADVLADPRYERPEQPTPFVPGAVLVAPISVHRGPSGVLFAANRRGGRGFDDEDLAFVEVVAGLVAAAMDRARLRGHLREAARPPRGDGGEHAAVGVSGEGRTELTGGSPAMKQLQSLIENAARSPLAVLIEGETGTGKELVARRIHALSARSELPFVALNCAALPETLLESELFGYRRGAFTGADRDRAGLFEISGGGSIFLDEVGEMSPAMQVKLLRVLQEGEILRIGDNLPRRIHARVIAATNRDLEREVRGGAFRADLYYRFAAFPIRVPPLRERQEDIPALVAQFLAEASSQHGKALAGIESDALAHLVAFDWPGNVRQLQNEIARAVALVRAGGRIGRVHLTPHPEATRVAGEVGSSAASGSARLGASELVEEEIKPLRVARGEFEAAYIVETLAEYGGNVSRTAQALGLSRVALHKKLVAHGIR